MRGKSYDFSVVMRIPPIPIRSETMRFVLRRLSWAARPFIGAALTLIVGALDSRLREDSLEAIREEKAVNLGVWHFYLHYTEGLLHGDLGESRALNRPI